METLNGISAGAGMISTFGLYAIVAALCFVCLHLYRRVNTLEAKLREALVDHATNSTKSFDEIKVMNEQMKDVIKANTDALQGVLRWIEREK